MTNQQFSSNQYQHPAIFSTKPAQLKQVLTKSLLGLFLLLASAYSYAFAFHQSNSGPAYYPNPSTLEESCKQYVDSLVDSRYGRD